MSRSDRPYRLTVICTGNICRSPMAEFLLREAFDDAGLGNRVEVDSAGMSDEERGNPPHRRTIATLQRHGHPDVGWDAHRAKQFHADDFEGVDLVLAADHPHVDRLKRIARGDEDREKVRLIRSFDPDAVAAGELGMDDPWYGADAEYEQTYQEISAAVPGIVDHVRTQLPT